MESINSSLLEDTRSWNRSKVLVSSNKYLHFQSNMQHYTVDRERTSRLFVELLASQRISTSRDQSRTGRMVCGCFMCYSLICTICIISYDFLVTSLFQFQKRYLDFLFSSPLHSFFYYHFVLSSQSNADIEFDTVTV
jgi:hypothetical protein